jgi:hypothetical protein
MVKPRIFGDHPLAKDANGKLKSRIGTVFPFSNTLITLPGIHATQRSAYLDMVNQERVRQGLPVMTRQEESNEWASSVDLIMESDAILIRPDPEKMDLAFRADERLQELVPKYKIRFLHLFHDQVRDAIKRRGECWRITSLPKSADEMRHMLITSRIGIGGREIYYYSKTTGTRYLTYEEFVRLASMNADELRGHMHEIREFSARTNPHGNTEIAFFMADPCFGKRDFEAYDFPRLEETALREVHAMLANRFQEAVSPGYRYDDFESSDWRSRMCMSLLGEADHVISEEMLLGLSSEFFMQVDWLPGGRIEDGELVFDTVFDGHDSINDPPHVRRLRDVKSRGFIFNFVREYGDLEYVNIGRVVGSLSKRRTKSGSRDVYVAQIKQRGSAEEIIKILRMQKWGVREHLNCGKSLLDAIMQAEEYTEYILDRRLACRQLGMNLPPRTTAHRVSERYYGWPGNPCDIQIWSTYFEREYIRGIASDKIPPHKLADQTYALRMFHLLGEAAAPNIIVGRGLKRGDGIEVVFDDGDEVIIENQQGFPAEIVVADHTGTFVDYESDLIAFAKAYADPVNRRLPYLTQHEQCANLYVEAFIARFNWIQLEYRKRKRAFDTLFQHRHWDEKGSLAFRWAKVSERLARTDARALGRCIRSYIEVPTSSDFAPDYLASDDSSEPRYG